MHFQSSLDWRKHLWIQWHVIKFFTFMLPVGVFPWAVITHNTIKLKHCRILNVCIFVLLWRYMAVVLTLTLPSILWCPQDHELSPTKEIDSFSHMHKHTQPPPPIPHAYTHTYTHTPFPMRYCIYKTTEENCNFLHVVAEGFVMKGIQR